VGFIAISPVMTRETMSKHVWRNYTFCGAAPPHGTRERKGTPSVEAPLLTILFRLQASEALVFTLSSQQHPGASPNSTPSVSHAHYEPFSLFIVGGRDCSPYPGALGKADLADRTDESRPSLQVFVWVESHSSSVQSLLFPFRRIHFLRCCFPRLPNSMSKQGAYEMRVGADSSSLAEAAGSQDAMDMRRLGKKQELNVRAPRHEAIKISHPLTDHSETSTPSPSWV
jgi:hypothetical protein